MNSLQITAPAKLNLCLRILGKRADGLHSLESLAAFTEYGDTLEITPADTLTLTVTGPFADALHISQDQNLVIKAASMLRLRAGSSQGARIVLNKQLPVGAGLGGGSSDAAAVLRALYRFWHIDYENDDTFLPPIAVKLGSDVPVCLKQQAAWMRGAGEQVISIAGFPEVALVLVNPRHELLTANVYGHVAPPFSRPAQLPKNFTSLTELITFLQTERNDLQSVATTLLPGINDVLAAIHATRGCLLTRMSGSGPTCFGLYGSMAEAQQAAQDLQHTYGAWWCVATRIYDWQKHGQAQ